MGILVSFLRGIVSLVLFAAAVTTVVIDMEFIGEKLGKYKLLRYGLIAGVVLLLFLIGFNSTCNVVIIAIDIYGVWAFFRRKKKMIWHGKSARQTKKKSEGPQSAIRKQRGYQKDRSGAGARTLPRGSRAGAPEGAVPIWLVLPEEASVVKKIRSRHLRT